MGPERRNGGEVVAKKIFVSIRNITRKTSKSLTRIKNEGAFNKAGFSLLELTITLIIVVTLVSLLMPKLNGLQDNAHKSYVLLTANSLQSAVSVTHSLWLSQGMRRAGLEGSLNAVTLLKGYGENNILMSNKGWPVDAMTHGDHSAQNLNTNLDFTHTTCVRLWNGLLKNSAPAPKVGLEVEADNIDKDQTEAIYLAQLESGICRYRYRLNQDGLRIHYDLATGQVITLF